VKRALVIGISGQDGAYLARLLLAKGYEVHGSSREQETGTFANLRRLGIRERVTLHSAHPADFSSVMSLLLGLPVDEIYNLSGQSSVAASFRHPLETFDSITVATMNLLECLRRLGRPVRFYNAGSSEIFGNTPSPADETTPFNPRSPYGIAKVAAHHAVANYREAYGLAASTGILFNHESPLRQAHFVTQKIVSAAVRIAAGSRERLRLGNVDVTRDWGWAPEYVDAMWRIVQHDPPEDFVVATGTTHSLREFIDRVFAAVGLDAGDHVDVDPGLVRPTDIESSRADPAKARAVLGWRPEYDLGRIVHDLVAAARSADDRVA
jgi:GDPmannose 4,6-dehydratase